MSKSRVRLFQCLDDLNKVETYEQFAALSAIAWDCGYSKEFAQAIDLVDGAPARATLRDWVEDRITILSIPKATSPHIPPGLLRNLATDH